jgi:hypothetical protein
VGIEPMITTHRAKEILDATDNPLTMVLCETIIDLWRMFGEANCDAVETRDELNELMIKIGKINHENRIN